MNTLPSRAYSGPFVPGALAATVVTRPFFDSQASCPVFIRRKHPVP